MKRVIAIVSFVIVTMGPAVVVTSCGPGQKTTNPSGTDSLSMQHNNGMDSSRVVDTSHLKNKGK